MVRNLLCGISCAPFFSHSGYVPQCLLVLVGLLPKRSSRSGTLDDNAALAGIFLAGAAAGFAGAAAFAVAAFPLVAGAADFAGALGFLCGSG